MACATVCGDNLAKNGFTAKLNFSQIWITMEKSLVKQAPDWRGEWSSNAAHFDKSNKEIQLKSI